MPHIEISDAAMAYLQSRAIPLIDSTVTVVDRLIEELNNLKEGTQEPPAKELSFKVDSTPSVKFTSVLSATVDGKKASQSYWNNILEDVVGACSAKGVSPDDIIGVMSANVHSGAFHDNGYRYVSSAGFSFQGLEANRAFKNIAALAQAFDIPLKITIRWQENEKAAYPNAKAEIVYP